jgi:hypothetical protein
MKSATIKSIIIKVAFTFSLFQVWVLKVSAQEGYVAPPNSVFAAHPASQPDTLRRVYLGLGIGINNYAGALGIGLDIRTVPQLLMRLGAGFGTWGTKVSIGLRYEEHPGKTGWIYGLAYTNSSGLSNYKISLMVDSANTVVTKDVNLNLLTASTLNLTVSRNWVFHRHNEFFFEFGYSIALQNNPFVVTDGSVLTNTSKEVINITAPGGFIIACGVMFGL